MPSVLFVCTGNLCRSPMAEGLLRALLARRGLEGWEVSSAGTWTVDGAPATPEAVQALEARGIDIRAHRSRRVTRALLERADLVLVATRAHAEALRAEFPDLAARVRLIGEPAGRPIDIADPIGESPGVYAATARQISGLLEEGLDAILAAAARGRGE